MPTSGDAVAFLRVLDQVCIPLLNNAKPADIVAAAHLRNGRDDTLYLPLDGGRRIVITPPSHNNASICTLDVVYDLDGGDAVFDALDAWASLHAVVLTALRVRQSISLDDERHIISSWSGAGSKGAEGLLLVQRERADGRPLSAKGEAAQITYSLTPN